MLTQERLKSLVNYNPDTGVFTCAKHRIGGTRQIGEPLGSLCNGYVEMGIDRRNYYAHRLAFLYMTGEFPSCPIDHINRCKTDNRWCNLRKVTVMENCHNQTRKADYNQTGFVGVHRCGKKFRAKINLANRQVHLGTFCTAEEAALAYSAAKAQMQPSMVQA